MQPENFLNQQISNLQNMLTNIEHLMENHSHDEVIKACLDEKRILRNILTSLHSPEPEGSVRQGMGMIDKQSVEEQLQSLKDHNYTVVLKMGRMAPHSDAFKGYVNLVRMNDQIVDNLESLVEKYR